MYRRLFILVVLAVGVFLSGCAMDREYARVRKSMEVDRLFRQGSMWPQYRYFYNGPKSEPLSLLALDRRYVLNSKFWTEFETDEHQLQLWLEEFRRITGEWDDIAYVRIDYKGSEILSRDNERIGMIYSRYDWVVVWWGEGNEVIIPPPQPSSSQRAPFMMRGMWRDR